MSGRNSEPRTRPSAWKASPGPRRARPGPGGRSPRSHRAGRPCRPHHARRYDLPHWRAGSDPRRLRRLAYSEPNGRAPSLVCAGGPDPRPWRDAQAPPQVTGCGVAPACAPHILPGGYPSPAAKRSIRTTSTIRIEAMTTCSAGTKTRAGDEAVRRSGRKHGGTRRTIWQQAGRRYRRSRPEGHRSAGRLASERGPRARCLASAGSCPFPRPCLGHAHVRRRGDQGREGERDGLADAHRQRWPHGDHRLHRRGDDGALASRCPPGSHPGRAGLAGRPGPRRRRW